MLDQNTDRMWYVIGAIVIGAAIIAMGLNIFDDSFNSVDDMMGSMMIRAEDNISLLGDRVSGVNLITSSNLKVDRTAFADMSNLDEIKLNITSADAMPGSLINGGLRIDHEVLPLEFNTHYVLSYTYQKFEGELVSFGGHTPRGLRYQDVRIDGVSTGLGYWDSESVFVGDDYDEHYVEVRFRTGSAYLDESIHNDLWIQPNRMNKVNVGVYIRNIKLEKGYTAS